MNRLKVWLYALLVVAAAAVTLRAHAARLRAHELAELDARLAAAAAQVSASSRALAREASAAAALAARDGRLVEALAAKEAAPSRLLPRKRAPQEDEAAENALREAARAALAAAESAFGFELPASSVVTAGNREWLARKGEPGPAEGETMAALRAAIGGKAMRGHVRLNGALYYGAASPVAQGSGLVALVPVDGAWAQAVAKAAAADVTLSAPDVTIFSTALPADAQALAAASPAGDAAIGVGQLGKVAVAIGPLALPPLPSLFGEVPAARARAVALEGVTGASAIVSLPTAPALGPVIAFEWKVLFGLAAVLLVGVALGLFVRSTDAPPAVPEALVAAAARVEKGDFAARAPALAGKLGTIAAALNKAAELAGPAAAAATAAAPARAPAAEEPLGHPLAPPAAAAFDPLAAPSPAAIPVAQAPALLQAAAQAAGPAGVEVDEDVHWQQVFQDFLRTRASCGEPTEGLTYDKFRLKLEGNKSALVAKYGCRTVKFQVYVKEGKAALKATPVK
jgi:hypothetical protein